MGTPKDTTEKFHFELIEKIYTVTNLTAKEKEHLAWAINEARLPPTADKEVYRMVVKYLGSTALFSVGGVVILQGIGVFYPGNHTIPTGLVALGSACIGALAGLLAPTPRG
jgi:hypothetical protein